MDNTSSQPAEIQETESSSEIPQLNPEPKVQGKPESYSMMDPKMRRIFGQSASAFRFREAIPLLERSIKEGKETAEVLMLLTSAYAYAGQLGKAQATADRAVRLFPNDPGSYITLANGYRLQAAYEEAARALMLAAELEPDQPIIWSELGFVQRFAGDLTAALQSFRKAALYAMPAMYGVRVYYHLAQQFLAEGDPKQAVSATAKMMSARDGLATWQSGLNALEGTAYGQALAREIAAIQAAIAEADSGTLG